MDNSKEIPVALIWDYENTSVNKDNHISTYQAIKNIKDLLKKCLGNIRIAEFIACANASKLSDIDRKQLYKGGVDVKDVPTGLNTADYELMIEMYKYARKHRPPTYIVLISGDTDFYMALETLTEMEYTTILAYPEKTKDLLKSSAYYTIEAKNFFSGTDLFYKTKRTNQSSTSATLVQRTNAQLTAVIWDANSCEIQLSDHRKAIDYIKKEVGKQLGISPANHATINMHIYGDFNKLPASEELRRATGATYTQTSRAKHEALESCMLVGILRFTIEKAESSNIVLITGNQHFARAAQCLRKLGYNVYIVVPSEGASQHLRDSANHLFTWPPTLKKQRPEKELYISPAAKKRPQNSPRG